MTDENDQPNLRRQRRQKQVDLSRIDRLPPASIEAEQGVMGCIMLDPQNALPEASAMIDVDHFYDRRHGALFQTFLDMEEERVAIDISTVQQRLRDAHCLDAVGGLAYLSMLVDAVPSAANIGYYCSIVEEKARRRAVIQTCTELVAEAYEDEVTDVGQFVDSAEARLLALSAARPYAQESFRDLVNGALRDVEAYNAANGAITGISTGFPDFDKMTQGLHGGEMVVIAGRPSKGKTTLCMNIAEYVAIDLGLPVGVFSLEMSPKSLALRLLCSRARVNIRGVMGGFMSDRDFPKITTAAARMHGAPIHIDGTSSLPIAQIRARARRMFRQHGIRLFVVDYLQLARGTGKRAERSREQEISEISSGLKGLAKDLDVPIIVASQLNRDIEREKARKPRLSDLRESGSVEQDADVVGMLYTPEENYDSHESADGCPTNLLIAKQRNGPTGDVNLIFLKGFTRFESAARVSADDLPPCQQQAALPYPKE